MVTVKTVDELRKFLDTQKSPSVGFVPTMGALHNGHTSLVEICAKKCALTICSIFVNPTQFNDQEDFKKYPISIEDDKALLLKHHCDVLFMPDVEEIYPRSLESDLNVDLGNIDTRLEGAHRPGHFDGVIQVVKRLLDIVQPDMLFLGKKDFQQCLIIEKMIMHYNLPVKVVRCPIVREKDGLAMSSRNRRLSPSARAVAPELYSVLQKIKENRSLYSPKDLTKTYSDYLNAFDLIKVEYLEIADSETLEQVNDWENHYAVNVFIAAKVGAIRLIDNLAIY